MGNRAGISNVVALSKQDIDTAPNDPKDRPQERAVIGPLKHMTVEMIAVFADRLASPQDRHIGPQYIQQTMCQRMLPHFSADFQS